MDPGIGKSLFRATLDRALALEPAGRIVVVTHREHVAGAQEECRDLAEATRERIVILAEPIGRNTAPAIAFGLAYLSATGSAPAASGGDLGGGHATADSQITLVLAADHLVSPTELFVQAVEQADFLAREDYLVTFGVKPTHAETGYGYIQRGERQGPGNVVAAFKEKPDKATAEQYLSDGGYLWNSGMFVFRARAFFDELAPHHPEIADPFRALDATADEFAAGAGASATRGGGPADQPAEPVAVVGQTPGLEDLYAQLPSISVDYAVMEKSSRAAVVTATFDWSDIGSWDEIAKLQTQVTTGGGSGNMSPNNMTADDPTADSAVVTVQAENNVVLSDIPVALCGVEDLIIVQKNGKLLVCRRGDSQLVKQVVESLKGANREQWL
jgi:mannose-1-phosphate guanylyltransferase